MKPWGSRARDAIAERLFLLGCSVRYTAQLETAYFFANWAGAVSTVAYTASYFLFIDVLFRNVPSFVGYTRAEMLFFMLVSQLSFYATWFWSINNVHLIEHDIRSGDFDLLLTKPVPLLFYAHTRRISLVTIVRNSTPAMVALCAVLPWQELSFRGTNLLAALAIFVLGQLALNAVQSILVLPAFWVAGAKTFTALYSDVGDKQMPAEALPHWFSLTFTVVVPLLLHASFTTGVALGHLDALPALAVAAGATITVSYLRVRLWQSALRSYTSASS